MPQCRHSFPLVLFSRSVLASRSFKGSRILGDFSSVSSRAGLVAKTKPSLRMTWNFWFHLILHPQNFCTAFGSFTTTMNNIDEGIFLCGNIQTAEVLTHFLHTWQVNSFSWIIPTCIFYFLSVVRIVQNSWQSCKMLEIIKRYRRWEDSGHLFCFLVIFLSHLQLQPRPLNFLDTFRPRYSLVWILSWSQIVWTGLWRDVPPPRLLRARGQASDMLDVLLHILWHLSDSDICHQRDLVFEARASLPRILVKKGRFFSC